MRHATVVVIFSAVFNAMLLPALPARALDCRQNAAGELQRLALGGDAIASIRYEEKRNPAERGPEMLGVRAWVRLKACKGYLVIDMTRSCFVRQSYTRGACQIDGATAY